MLTLIRLYITHIKIHPLTGEHYVGMASGLAKDDSRISAEKVLKRREQAPHHRNKDGFGEADIDKISKNRKAIKGREQMLKDHFDSQGIGAKQNNPISPRNKKRAEYLKTALAVFGDVAMGMMIYAHF